MAEWTCTRCGGPAKRLEGFTLLDERYAVGYCDKCTPIPKKRKRSTVPVVLTKLWNPAILDERRKSAKEHRLLERSVATVNERPLTDEEKSEARAILARYEGLWRE